MFVKPIQSLEMADSLFLYYNENTYYQGIKYS